MNIDELFVEFNKSANESKESLKRMLEVVSSGRVPSKEDRNKLDNVIDALCKKYDSICVFAEERLSEDEMLEDGSSVTDYYEAIKNSRFTAFHNQINEIKEVLAKFVSVQSLVLNLESALEPFKKNAESLLKKIESGGVADIADVAEEIGGPQLFVRAMEYMDLNSDEGNEILDSLEENYGYPSRVTRGLSSKSYFLPNEEGSAQPCDQVSAAEKESDKFDVSITTTEIVKKEEDKAENVNNSENVDNQKSAFRQSIENAGFAFEDSEFGILSSEISTAETKKISASVFSNDLRKGNVKVFKSIIQQVCSSTVISPELLAIRYNMPQNIAVGSLDFLQRKGYLRKYKLMPVGEFYCSSPRLERSLTYKDASKFVGVRQLSADSLGELVEDNASCAAARLTFLKLYMNSTKNYVESGVKQHTSSSVTMTEAFVFRSFDTSNPDYSEILIGAFWTNYDECDEFIEAFEKKLEDAVKVQRFVIASETKESAELLADEIKKCAYEKLSGITWFIYSLKNDAYYQYDTEIVTEIGNIWPVLSEKGISNDIDKEELLSGDIQKKDDGQEIDIPKTDELIVEKEENPIPAVKKETVAPVNIAEIPQTDDIEAILCKLINGRKHYCATAYAKARSIKDNLLSDIYDKVAYALNDPMRHCVYSADRVFDLIPTNHNEFSDDLVVAIGIRTFFYNQVSYDYNIKAFYNAIKEYKVLNEYPSLSNVIYKLVEFKGNQKKGIDTYADYREKSVAQLEDELKKIQREAKIYYDNSIVGKKQENASQKRFLETKKMLLNPNGDIGQYIRAVVEDDRDVQPLIVEFLQEKFIREDSTISEENIDTNMLWNFIVKYWDEAGAKMVYRRREDLMSHLRSNIISVTTKAIQIMIRWCILVDKVGNQTEDAGAIEYKKIRKTLLNEITDSLTAIEAAEKKANKPETELAGLEVIRYALDEVKRCIEGTYGEYERRYFYIPFLMTDDILLDDTFCPDFAVHSSEMAELQPENRILEHAHKTSQHCEDRLLEILKDRLSEILEDNGDDYGTARLIVEYLAETALSIDTEMYRRNISLGEEYAKETAYLRKEQFIGDLELAQSYGQIDNVNSTEDKKEKILQIVNEWYESCVDSANYGFFKRIMDSYLEEIRRESKTREKDLVEQLDALKLTTIKGISSEAKEKKISRIQAALAQQNYTVAEDLLARADQSDDDHMDVVEEDFLGDFLDDYNDYYKIVAKSQVSFATLVSGHTRNKQERGGRRLADNWLPGGSKLGITRLVGLLTGFGFKVDSNSVQELNPIGKFENFFVRTLAAKDGKRENYTHPIAAFGSGASREGFRVVCLNGKYDTVGLIAVMKEIGNAKHTMILLDSALDKPERRILARKSKSELGDKLFVVVDRAVMMYMVKNYDETKVNRMLMALITPFGYYQPYVWESSNVMPPEIFMGRKHELERIESSTGVNIVYGGRQLGKSALLKQAKADIDRDENGDRAVLVDIKGLNCQDAAKKIGHALYDEGVLTEDITTTDWDELSRAIRKRLQTDKHRIPYLLLLIDEADTFIESCEASNYRPFDSLKEIQSIGVGRFKFVIAGLRNIVRFKREAALGNNSVLTHLDSMTVKPFHSIEARELMEIPLHYMGLKFPKENESLITLILASTNYFPGLIQMYCAKLLSAMRSKDYAGYDEADTPVYEISEEHIKKVLADPEFMEQIREKFIITLKLDEDNYYYLIALIMAYLYHTNGYNDGYSAEDIKNAGKNLDIAKIAKLNDDKLSVFMEELKELNVLRSTDDTRYLFTRFTFFQMMGTSSEVDAKLIEYMEY